MYEPFCHGQDGFFNTIRKMAQDRREPSAVHVVGNMDWDGLHRPQIYYAMVAIFSGLFLSVMTTTNWKALTIQMESEEEICN